MEYYDGERISPQIDDILRVNSVIVRDRYGNDITSCGAVTNEKIYIDYDLYCADCWTCDNCEVVVSVTGSFSDSFSQFTLTKGSTVKKTMDFTMQSNDVSFNVLVKEVDVLFDDVVHDQSYSISNVSQEEKDGNLPHIPPIDLSKIDLSSIFIGSAAGGALGLAFEGKAGAIQFGILGGVGALAYSYLTTT